MVLSLIGPGGPLRVDLLVSFPPAVKAWRSARELERYDHLISGWCQTHRRYRDHGPPAAVFVCRDAAAARELCALADGVVTACWAYPGEDPARWPYLGRQRLFFADELDVHRGSLAAYVLPPLPPDVRQASPGSFALQRREIVARALRE
jgi:hypothetical protein